MENQELLAYRRRMLDRTLAAAEEFCKACRAVKNPFAAVQAGGWNVHQIAVHVRDVDAQVYGRRVKRTLSEDHPTFENFDQEEWLKEHYDAKEPLARVLGDFQASIVDLVGRLRAADVGAWSRMSRHEIDGDRTMQMWAERGLAHIEEHLATVSQAK